MTYKYDKAVARRRLQVQDTSLLQVSSPATRQTNLTIQKRRTLSVGQKRKSPAVVAITQPNAPLDKSDESKPVEVVGIVEDDTNPVDIQTPKLKKLAELVAAAQYMERKMEARKSAADVPNATNKRPAAQLPSDLEAPQAKRPKKEEEE